MWTVILGEEVVKSLVEIGEIGCFAKVVAVLRDLKVGRASLNDIGKKVGSDRKGGERKCGGSGCTNKASFGGALRKKEQTKWMDDDVTADRGGRKRGQICHAGMRGVLLESCQHFREFRITERVSVSVTMMGVFVINYP